MARGTARALPTQLAFAGARARPAGGALTIPFGSSRPFAILPFGNCRLRMWTRCFRVAPAGALKTAEADGADWTNTTHGWAEQTDEEVVAAGQEIPASGGNWTLGATARGTTARGTGMWKTDAVRAAAGVALIVFEPAPATEMATIAPTAITQIPTLTIRRMTEPVSARSRGAATLSPSRR